MSELENENLKVALEWYDEDAGQVLPGSVPHERIVDAARRLLNLTSPETIEKAKSIIGETFIKELGWGESKPFAALEVYAIARVAAEAVLRSVEEGTQ